MEQRSNKSDLSDAGKKPEARHRALWIWLWAGLILITSVLGIGRLLLPTLVRHYVNRTLDRNIAYEGRIGAVGIHLLRGAYSIHNVRISHRTGDVPVPFFLASNVDFSIDWKALFHHRIVCQVLMESPELNFVDNPNPEGESQTGAGAPWLQMIRDLAPFNVNSAVVQDGAVHFRAYQSKKPVDVYLTHLNGVIDDLGNIDDQTKPLVTRVQASAVAMDQAALDFKMNLDPFSYHPTFHLAVRLLGLDVTKLNDLALTYGKFDFKRGWFDLVLEADSKEGQLNGYIKPLFRNLKVFSLNQDIQEDTVIQFFWQALVGGMTTIFKNFHRDQFGTLIPFTGDASGVTTTDILATVGNILRNAFVRAYLPRLEQGQSTEEDVEFGPPDFTQALTSAQESP